MPHLFTYDIQTIYSPRLSFQIQQLTKKKAICCPLPRKTNSRSCIHNGGITNPQKGGRNQFLGHEKPQIQWSVALPSSTYLKELFFGIEFLLSGRT